MTRLLTFFIGALIVASAGPALAQSPQELRQENDQLRSRVADLERELSSALQEVNRLRAELAAAVAGGTSAVGVLPAPEVTIDESTPEASPRALFASLAASYLESTAELIDRVEPGDRLHLRALQRWASRIERELRQSVEWHVRMTESARAVRNGWVLRLQAVDPVTGTPLGDPFDALLAQGVVNRLKALEDRHQLPDVVILQGTMHPEIVINPDRGEPGPFDNPRLIGPYAEFGLSVVAKAIAMPHEQSAPKTGG